MMNRKFFYFVLITFLAFFTESTIIAADIDSKNQKLYRNGEILVKYRDGALRARSAMNKLHDRIALLELRRFSPNMGNFEHIFFEENKVSMEEAIRILEQDPAVEYAHPNYIVHTFPIKNEEVEVAEEVPCVIPGFPYPPGCTDPSGGANPPPSEGGEVPCIIPGFPYPPGCTDPGGGTNPPPGEGGEVPCIIPGFPYPPGCTDPGGPTNPPSRPPIEELPEEPAFIEDPNISKSYGLERIEAKKAWEIQEGTKDIVVAVIDTGVDYNHPDLAFNMWRNPDADTILETGVDPNGSNISGDIVGWDFVHGDNLPYDDNMHGTHCAGVIGAVGDNGQGSSGVAKRVSIMAIKFLDNRGAGDVANAIHAIDYAISRGAKILSNSWGGEETIPGQGKALEDAVQRAKDAGILFVAAAGNSSSNNDRRPVFPASIKLENVLSVAATNSKDAMAFFSNYGPNSVHLAAPGDAVYSTVPKNGYRSLSGTSMAAPHVAGAAAILWSQFPEATYDEIKDRLMQFGDELNTLSNKTISGKRINVFKALEGEL